MKNQHRKKTAKTKAIIACECHKEHHKSSSTSSHVQPISGIDAGDRFGLQNDNLEKLKKDTQMDPNWEPTWNRYGSQVGPTKDRAQNLKANVVTN